jgi:hypothetical protein
MSASLLRNGFLAAALLALAGAPSPGAAPRRERSPAEVRALVERVIANQHRNDDAAMEYERFERRVARKSGEEGRIVEDKTFRVVPTGTGTVRVLTEENGRAVSPETHHKQLRGLEQALAWALEPQEPRQKQRVEKWERRRRERAEMVDAVREAFRITWLGDEPQNGRTLVKLLLEPAPDYRATSRVTDLFRHVRATLWVDEAAGQAVRVEAEIIRDISFGGGVLGKIYRGGRFRMEQKEVAPGLWLPVLYQYDFEGRRFVFGFRVHEQTRAENYRRIGPLEEALAAIRRELAGSRTDGTE